MKTLKITFAALSIISFLLISGCAVHTYGERGCDLCVSQVKTIDSVTSCHRCSAPDPCVTPCHHYDYAPWMDCGW